MLLNGRVMKVLLLVIACVLGGISAVAQVSNPSVIYVGASPSGSCAQAPPIQILNSTGAIYTCDNGTWAVQGGGSGGGVTSLTGDGTIISNSASTGAVTLTLANTPTGTGGVVLATSPTLVTPALGTPSSGVITNLTGTCTACTANSATTATTAINLSGGSTVTGTPAASTAAIQTNATLFTGGSGTTTFPYWMIQPSGATAETAWSTSGTLLGINTASGFAGNFLDFHVNNGASMVKITSTGGIITVGGIAASGVITSGSTKFTASGCTSITSTVSSNGTSGKFTIGANSCTVVITMNGATGLTASNGWSCHANDETTAAGNTGLYFSTNNTTTATLTVPATAAANDVIDFGCQAF